MNPPNNQTKPVVWVVDDDDSIRFVLSKALELDGLEVSAFNHAQAAIDALSQALATAEGKPPAVLISDIRMPGMSGLELLQALKNQKPDLPIIIMTAYSDLDSAVNSFELGAFDYLAKPFDLKDAVAMVQRALQNQATKSPQSPLADTKADSSSVGLPSVDSANKSREMLGFAPAMQVLFRAIGRLRQSQAMVLITGESGSGKELVARALHKHSQTTQGPFIAINTAAIPKDLLESELFGHERGAFTGAQGQRIGRFEQASGGTLFLDEIGDMPLDLQTRLLRVLSEGQFYRVGGTQAIQSKVRVIAATHQNLENSVSEGTFRADLYHRLNVIRLRIPSLRERQEDIPLLAKYFLQQAAHSNQVEDKTFSPQSLEQLCAFDFPGNVRQLENICHWLSIMAPGKVIQAQDLPPEVLQQNQANQPKTSNTQPVAPSGTEALPQPNAPANLASTNTPDTQAESWQQALAQSAYAMLHNKEPAIWETLVAECEKTLVETALEYTQGRKVQAAEALGIGRNTITRKMQVLKDIEV